MYLDTEAFTIIMQGLKHAQELRREEIINELEAIVEFDQDYDREEQV